MTKTIYNFRKFSSLFLVFVYLMLNSFMLIASNKQTLTDFNLNAAQNIDSRISNKHDIRLNRFVFNTAIDLINLYERNADCWAYDLDLTCASPYNSSGGKNKAGTLITPRHALLAAHYKINNGDSIRFITKNNQIVRRKVIANSIRTNVSNNKPDIQLVLLDSDVPTTITPCQFLPADYDTYLNNDGAGLPTLFFDQTEKAAVGEVSSISSGGGWGIAGFYQQVPTLPNRLALNLTVITGDSGNPVFLVLNNKLVLLGLFTYGGAGSGTSLTYIANLPDGGSAVNLDQNLNDIIKETDALAGLNTGYQVSFFDFSAPISVGINNVESQNKISVKGRTLEIKIQNIDNTQLNVYDIYGRIIVNQKLTSLLSNFALPLNGIYIVSIQSEKAQLTKKIIVN
ncbi:MAG: T9SS type A sorting domain-containing protein [Paludibacter sp.]